MEDQVPFKVFTFWSRNAKPEVRRFGIEKTVVTSFHYLNAKLQDVYPGLKGKSYSVAWKDDEGDDVTVSSDEEVLTALQALNGAVIKLYVYCKAEGPKNDGCNLVFATVTNDVSAAEAATVHYGVVCDACDTGIVGFRYKCTTCADFDLCSRCESAGHHPQHCMVRVPQPSMPRAMIRDAIKRSRSFLKTMVHTMAEDSPYKKQRPERSADGRRYRPQSAGERADQGHSSRDHHRRQRVSWLDTFSTYMNEFANLAGDINVDAPPAPPASATPAASAAPAQAQAQNPNPNPEPMKTEPGTTPAPAYMPPQPQMAADGYMYGPPQPIPVIPVNFDAIREILESYMGGFAYMPEQNYAQASAPAPAPTPAGPPAGAPAQAANYVDSTTAGPAWYPEMGQGDSKKQDNDVPMETATSAGNVNGRDASPDKADDWTVINKEKDMMDATGSNDAGAPIGFNLPEEFQDRVKISDGAIYPPLNPATAVLNTKVAEGPTAAASAPPAASAAEKPAAEKAAAPPKSETQTQPRQRHPLAHIDAAIQQMLTMGFTNEGGWLTRLLENKDGNIAAVLDLLTPVKK